MPDDRTTVNLTKKTAVKIREYIGYRGFTTMTDFVEKACKKMLDHLEGKES